MRAHVGLSSPKIDVQRARRRETTLRSSTRTAVHECALVCTCHTGHFALARKQIFCPVCPTPIAIPKTNQLIHTFCVSQMEFVTRQTFHSKIVRFGSEQPRPPEVSILDRTKKKKTPSKHFRRQWLAVLIPELSFVCMAEIISSFSAENTTVGMTDPKVTCQKCPQCPKIPGFVRIYSKQEQNRIKGETHKNLSSHTVRIVY